MPVSNGEEGHSFIKAEDAYEYIYGKPVEEEKPEVAPVQPKRVEVPKKAEPKKEAPKKVIKEPEPVEAEPADDSDEENQRQCCDPEPEEVSGEVVEESGLLKNEESEVEEVKGEIIEDEEDEVDPRGQLIVNVQISINRAKFMIGEEVDRVNKREQIQTENLIKCKQELEKAIKEIEEVIR